MEIDQGHEEQYGNLNAAAVWDATSEHQEAEKAG